MTAHPPTTRRVKRIRKKDSWLRDRRQSEDRLRGHRVPGRSEQPRYPGRLHHRLQRRRRYLGRGFENDIPEKHSLAGKELACFIFVGQSPNGASSASSTKHSCGLGRRSLLSSRKPRSFGRSMVFKTGTTSQTTEALSPPREVEPRSFRCGLYFFSGLF